MDDMIRKYSCLFAKRDWLFPILCIPFGLIVVFVLWLTKEGVLWLIGLLN